MLEDVPPQKVAVFATYGETIQYLDENLPAPIAGRERVVVVGRPLSFWDPRVVEASRAR